MNKFFTGFINIAEKVTYHGTIVDGGPGIMAKIFGVLVQKSAIS